MTRFALHILLLLFPLAIFGQIAEKEAIGMALRNGDAKALAGYMTQSIDLTVVDLENVYSRNQAEVILGQFFAKQKPLNFEVRHEGKSKLEDFYYIGDLTTNTNVFRLTFFLKKEGNVFRIKQLRIEPE